MPSTSAKVKIDAVRQYGAQVDLIDTRVKPRQERVQELAAANPGFYVASPYDDPLVIEGNSSLGQEIAGLPIALDAVVVPIGGGGLASGIIVGSRKLGSQIPVVGVEPALANDAARSLREGRLISNEIEPQTIADGARTISLGKHNWEILQSALEQIIEVPELTIKKAVGLLFSLANLKAEPTGALSVAAVLERPERFRNRSVCCIVSGGNVDSTVYSGLLAGSDCS